MNHSDGGILLAYDLAKRDVGLTKALACMNLPRGIFCDLAACDEVIGAVTAEAAEQSGLPAGPTWWLPAYGEDTEQRGAGDGRGFERRCAAFHGIGQHVVCASAGHAKRRKFASFSACD